MSREQIAMRVTTAVPRKKRVKRTMKAARGYRGSRSKTYKMARNTLDRALRFAYIHRRQKKRDFRRLWIMRINAAARSEGMTYSAFMNGLKQAGVTVDRRQLSELAIHDPAAFGQLVEAARSAG